MIFAAMVEDVIWDKGKHLSRKVTVSIIDLATKWKIQDVSFLYHDEGEEVLARLLVYSADKCALAYGYFLASI